PPGTSQHTHTHASPYTTLFRAQDGSILKCTQPGPTATMDSSGTAWFEGWQITYVPPTNQPATSTANFSFEIDVRYDQGVSTIWMFGRAGAWITVTAVARVTT